MSKFYQQNIRAGKLRPDEVLQLRKLYHEEGWTQGALSRKFQISVGQVGRIVRGESWQQFAMPVSEEEIQHRMVEPGAPTEAEAEASLNALQRILASDAERRGEDQALPDPVEEILARRARTPSGVPQETRTGPPVPPLASETGHECPGEDHASDE